MLKSEIKTALDKGKATQTVYDDLNFVRITDSSGGLRRGTAVFDAGTVYGYPRIGRVLALEAGLAEQFAEPFWMEEKIDGYNVRIVRVHDQLIALTRGGFICPFTTDRIPDLIDTSIFDKNPNLIVCAEVAGPDNPYLEGGPSFIPHDVRLFVFDLMHWNQPGFLPHANKIQLQERYGLPTVRIFGRFDISAIPQIHEILIRLNDEEREGVVFKEDSERNHRAKYVTSNSNLSDIRALAARIRDLPPEYFTDRILRLVLFLHEQKLVRTEELDRQLGAAFIDGLQDSIAQFLSEHKVYHTFRCRFRSRENAMKLIAHMNQTAGHVKIHRRNLYQEQGYWLLEFDRMYPALNGLLSHLLSGGLMID